MQAGYLSSLRPLEVVRHHDVNPQPNKCFFSFGSRSSKHDHPFPNLDVTIPCLCFTPSHDVVGKERL